MVAVLPGVSQADNSLPAPLASNELLIINGSGKCLEIVNSSTANGADASQWSCVGQPGAVWQLVKPTGTNDTSAYWIRNVNSGKCLEIENGWKHNGAPAQQWTCTPGVAAQLWRTGGISYTSIPGKSLYNLGTQHWLEVENSSSSNGARVQQWDYANVTGQIWKTNLGT